MVCNVRRNVWNVRTSGQNPDMFLTMEPRGTNSSELRLEARIMTQPHFIIRQAMHSGPYV
jgi:hypothetical protein